HAGFPRVGARRPRSLARQLAEFPPHSGQSSSARVPSRRIERSRGRTRRYSRGAWSTVSPVAVKRKSSAACAAAVASRTPPGRVGGRGAGRLGRPRPQGSSETPRADQPAAVLLEYTRDGVGAQKAMMLTNSDFTEGAHGIADRYGIALHVVRPEFDTSTLPTGSSEAVRQQIAAALEATAAAAGGRPLYSFTIVHRAFEPDAGAPPAAPSAAPGYAAPSVQQSNRVMGGYANRVASAVAEGA